MRLWLTRIIRFLRRQGSIPCAKHAFAQCAKSDTHRRLFSSFYAPWLPPSVQQKRAVPGTNIIAPTCAVGGQLRLKSRCSPTLEFLREFCDGPGQEGKQTVDVSSELWELLKEYDVPNTIRHVFNVHIQAAQTTSNEVQLTLRGQQAPEVAAMLVDPPRKLDVHQQVGFWLTSRGPYGTRVIDIRKIYGALVKPSKDNKSVLLVGPSNATLDAKCIIDACDCVEEFDIDNFVGFYLINNDAFHVKRLSVETDALVSAPRLFCAAKWKAVAVGPTESVKRLRRKLDALHVARRQVPHAVCRWLTSPGRDDECARSVELCRNFDTYIHLGPHKDASDPARMVDLVAVGESKQSVDDALAILGGLRVEHRQIPQAAYRWLTNRSRGAMFARATDLERKFDTCISMKRPSDDNPACAVDVTVVGEREVDVAQVVATIHNVAVESVGVTKLQLEFWYGHDGEEKRPCPHDRLQDRTDTYFLRDDGTSCVHVAGRPDAVREALKEISKTQCIGLRTSVVSFAMRNYIRREGRAYENDDRQIHLINIDVRPGTCELRRLYVVAGQDDDAEADRADDDMMRKLNLDEVVLEVPMWAQFLVKKCYEMELSTGAGIGFSRDAIKGRVLIDIAGSRSTVKEGMNEIIRRIEAHDRYKEGDIGLRRIEGQSVVTAGFKKVADAKPLDSRYRKEPFFWERLTQERWCYVGASRDGRPPKRPRQPSV